MAKLKKEVVYLLVSPDEYSSQYSNMLGDLLSLYKDGYKPLHYEGTPKNYTPKNIVADIMEKRKIQNIRSFMVTNKAKDTDFMWETMDLLSTELKKEDYAQRVQQRTR